MRHRIVSRAKLGGEELAYSESRIVLDDLTAYNFSWIKDELLEDDLLGQKGPLLASGLYL